MHSVSFVAVLFGGTLSLHRWLTRASSSWHGHRPSSTALSTVNDLLERFDMNVEQWTRLGVFQDESYSRVLLFANAHFSAMLLW